MNSAGLDNSCDAVCLTRGCGGNPLPFNFASVYAHYKYYVQYSGHFHCSIVTQHAIPNTCSYTTLDIRVKVCCYTVNPGYICYSYLFLLSSFDELAECFPEYHHLSY